MTFERLVKFQAVISEMRSGPLVATPDTLRTYTLALVVEVGELLNSINWKPWKARFEVDGERAVDEWGDLLAFFLIVTDLTAQLLGVDPTYMLNYYLTKTSGKNVARFSNTVDAYKMDRPVEGGIGE